MSRKLEFLNFQGQSDKHLPGINHKLLLYSCTHENSRPMFVFDLERIMSNYRIISDAFQGCNVYYALKANSEIQILKTLKQMGCNFEAASIGEVDRLMSLKVGPERIIYSNPCKSKDDIIRLAALGIHYFSFESIVDLERLIKLVPDGIFVLRLNLTEIDPIHINYGAAWSYIEKNIFSQPKYANAIKGITYYGIHSIGIEVCEKILATRKLPNLKFINLGGAIQFDSFKVDLDNGIYNNSLNEITQKLKILKEHFKIDLILEPGSAMIYNACNAICTIKYVNDNCSEKLNYHVNLGPTLGLRKPPRIAFVLRKSEAGDIVQQGNLLDAACSQRCIGVFESHRQLMENDEIIIPNVAMYSTMYISDFHLLEKPELVFIP